MEEFESQESKVKSKKASAWAAIIKKSKVKSKKGFRLEGFTCRRCGQRVSWY